MLYCNLEVKELKKILVVFLLVLTLAFSGCSTEDPEKSFEKLISEASSYKVDGVMESFYENGKKENNFTVYYKSPDLIKVVISSSDNDNKQVILKNTEGVYILIPAVNKNFKIQSSWPQNASYPYLLQSLSKDIINDSGVIKTETEQYITLETNTKMYTDAVATKQKIIIDKATSLPTEVLVYDDKGELYIRCVFTNIQIGYNINDNEFVVTESMSKLRAEELNVFSNREFLIPSYLPSGSSTTTDDTLVTGTGDDMTSIMKFTGSNTFTIIQEYVNDSEDLSTMVGSGEIVMVLGNVGVFSNKSLEVYYEGINYTLASSSLDMDEMIKIVSSYFVTTEK